MIRLATLPDAPEIARVQLQAYRETYPHWPRSYLESLTAEGQTAYWTQRLGAHDPEKAYFVAEAGGALVGFASGGKVSQDGDPEFSSELYTLYLLQSVQGRGLGGQLFLSVTDFLTEKDHQTMLCWVHSANVRACGFYGRMGGRRAREKMSSRIQGELMYGYGWPDLKAVVR